MKLFSLSTCLLLSIAAAGLPSDLSAQAVRPPQCPFDLAGSQTDLGPFALATDEDLTALLWRGEFRSELLLSTSDGRGLEWTTPQIIDGDLAGLHEKEIDPEESIFIAGDDVYAIYMDFGSRVFLTRSNDRGVSFSAPQQLDFDPMLRADGIQAWRAAVVKGDPFDTIYVAAIADDFSNTGSVQLLKSTDSGATFGPPIQVAQSVAPFAFDVSTLDLEVVDNDVHIGWVDGRNGALRPYLQLSTDGGATWLASDRAIGTGSGRVREMRIAALPGQLAMVTFAEDVPGCRT